MSPAKHLAAGGLLSGATYALTNDPYHSLAIAAGSVAIDLDHIYDFCREWGWKEGIRKLCIAGLGRVKPVFRQHVFVFLHGWDLLLLCFLVFPLLFENFYWYPFLIGVTVHLFMDQIGNEFGPLGYILSYRIYRRFSRPALTREPAPELP